MTESVANKDQPTSGQLVSTFPKQAIVVIHGMGEQRPMDTIKSFARAVWSNDETVWQNKLFHPGEIWSKPDDRTGSLELRRLTTRPSTPSDTFGKGARQDFYELYWADLSGGSTWDHVKSWIAMLLFRNPFTDVPRRVLPAWILLWAVTLASLVFVVASIVPEPGRDIDGGDYRPWIWNYWPFTCLIGVAGWQLLGLVGVLGWMAHNVVVPYFGRVVRYTRAIPDNIAARAAIRARGTELLKALHEEEYDRIIVVGHSLGAILAYDLVSYYWAMNLPSHTVEEGSQEFVVLRELEQLAADLAGNLDAATREKRINAWHDTRRCFCRLLRRRAKPMAKGEQDRRWLITDLITVGSPLGHADFLLAKDAEDRQLRIEERELAMSPPVREVLDLETIKLARAAGLPVGQELDPQTMELARKAGLPVREVLDPETIELARAAGLPVGERPALFSFPLKHHSEWQLHHAAQFAAVGWTNIHDPSIAVFLGDVVSAPAAPIFGPGVIDVNLRREQGQSLWFTHLDYWLDGEPTPTPLAQLRHALDLAAQRHP